MRSRQSKHAVLLAVTLGQGGMPHEQLLAPCNVKSFIVSILMYLHHVCSESSACPLSEQRHTPVRQYMSRRIREWLYAA